MTEYEAYQEHIRYTHDTYCRIVIRHASFDAARMLAARWKREISLEYLTEEKFVPLSTTDGYFQVPDYGETYPFSVRGQTIFLDSRSLAAALAELPEQTQEEIFLYYFQHLTQKEIGEQSGWTRSTIGRHPAKVDATPGCRQHREQLRFRPGGRTDLPLGVSASRLQKALFSPMAVQHGGKRHPGRLCSPQTVN